MGDLPRIDADQFLRRLALQLSIEPGLSFTDVQELVPRTQFAFFLGAGCSVTSGVPSASQVVSDQWLKQAMFVLTGERDVEREHALAWAEGYSAEPLVGFDRERPAAHYGRLFAFLFPTPAEARKETRRLVSSARPSPGYLTLARLMQWTGFDCAITTNFDDLIAHASVVVGRGLPRLYGHDAAYVDYDADVREPVVLKLHGDAHLKPRHTEEQTSALPTRTQDVVREELRKRGLIVVGYGGHDESIVGGLLEPIVKEPVPHPWYWCVRKGDRIPQRVEEVLRAAHALVVEIDDFDSVIESIGKIAGLTQSDVYEQVRTLTDRYQDITLQKSASTKARRTPRPEGSSELIPATTRGRTARRKAQDWFQAYLEAQEQDDARTKVEALLAVDRQFPGHPEVESAIGYAFLEANDPLSSVPYFRQAAEHPDAGEGEIGNLATVLHASGAREEAEQLYRNILRPQMYHSFVPGNLACKLIEDGKYDEALPLLREALADADLPDSQVLRYLMYQLLIEPNLRQSIRQRMSQVIASDPRPYHWWNYEPLLRQASGEPDVSPLLTELVRLIERRERLSKILDISASDESGTARLLLGGEEHTGRPTE